MSRFSFKEVSKYNFEMKPRFY